MVQLQPSTLPPVEAPKVMTKTWQRKVEWTVWALFGVFMPLGNTTLASTGLIALTLWQGAQRGGRRALFRATDVPLALLFGAGLLSSFLAAPSKRLSLLYLLGLVLLVLGPFWQARRLAMEEPEWIRSVLAPTAAIGALLAGSVAVVRLALGDPRPGGVWMGAQGFSTLLIMSLGFGLPYFATRPSRIRWGIPFAAILTAAELATLTRGGWLGFATTSLTASWRRKRWSLVIALVVVAGVLSLTIPHVAERVRGFFDNDRILVWGVTLQIIRDHWLFGVGPGNYSFAYAEYAPWVKDGFPILAHAHNFFLQIAVEFGVLGLVPFMALWLYIFRLAWGLWRGNDRVGQILASTLFGVLVSQQFDNTVYGMELGGAFWVLSGLIVGYALRFKAADRSAECVEMNKDTASLSPGATIS